MAGYIDAVSALNPVHYFPLNGGTNGYTVNDAVGATTADPANTRGTNYKNFVNQGGVTFSTASGVAGAVFNGATNSWLQAPTDPGFSVISDAPPDVVSTLTIVFWIYLPSYNIGGDNLHFMAKGDAGPSNWLEWSMRLYGDGSPAGRDRNISNYYWNPDSSVCSHGFSVDSNRGSGAFLAPPEGARTPPNGPTGSGDPNTWHMIAATWYTTSSTRNAHIGTGAGTSTDLVYGGAKMFYGSTANAAALVGSTRSLRADACVQPYYTNGPLTLGRRVENSWALTGTVRRLAFFNYELSPANLETLRQAHITYGDTEGVLGAGGGGGGGFFIPVAKPLYSSGAGASSSASLGVPALGANDLHVIAVATNALASGNGFTTPSGYTAATGTANDNFPATTNAASAVFYRQGPATANPSLTITANGSGRLEATHAVIPDVSSVQATTAFASGSGSTTLTSPTLTPAASGRMLLTCWAERGSTTNVAVTFSGLSGTGASIVTQGSTSNTGNFNVATAIGYEITSGTSPTGTRTLTASQAGTWNAYSLLLARVAVSNINTFTDSFTTFDTSNWTRSDTSDVNASGGFLTLRADPGETQNATSVRSYSLTGSNIYAKFIPVPTTTSASGQFMLQDASTTDSDFGMRVDSDASGVKTLRMGRRTGVNATPVWAGDLTISYDNVNHQYMRIIESGGTVSFQTSNQNPAAGGTWTTRHTMTTPAYAGAIKVYITTARAPSGTGTLNPSQFSELNATAVVDPTPSPTVSAMAQLADNFSSQDSTKWNYATGQGVVSGDKLLIPATSAGGRLRSRDYWNLENSQLDVNISPATGGVGPITSVMIEKHDTSGTMFKVEVTDTNVVSYGLQVGSAWSAGFPFTFTLAAGSRIRIREGTAVGGSTPDRIFVDTGVWSAPAQTYTWTARSGTGVASPSWITQTRVILAAQNISGTSSSAQFDNLNTEDAVGATPVPPISDSFDGASIDATKWTSYGTPTQVGGNLVLDGVEGVVSVNRINLLGDRQYVNLVEVTTAAGTYSVFRLERNGTNALQFRFQDGSIYAEKIVSGVQTVVGSVVFNATNTKYVQIREASGLIYFEYGSVPGSMTTIGSAMTAPFAVNSLLLRLERSV